MKSNVTKAIGAMIIALFVSQNIFAQPNGNPNPNATWKANGKDTVETNRVVKVNNTVEADTIHSKRGIVVGDGSFFIVDDVSVGLLNVDEIRSSQGIIALGKGFDLTTCEVPPATFKNILVGIGNSFFL